MCLVNKNSIKVYLLTAMFAVIPMSVTANTDVKDQNDIEIEVEKLIQLEKVIKDAAEKTTTGGDDNPKPPSCIYPLCTGE